MERPVRRSIIIVFFGLRNPVAREGRARNSVQVGQDGGSRRLAFRAV
jgi:hypothetical protein